MAKLTGKIIISGTITATTGLHIGGSKSSLDIGGVDLNVIKTRRGVPFIPGSSLKGKLRSMLAKTQNSIAVSKKQLRDDKEAEHELRDRYGKDYKTDEEVPFIIQLFGEAGDNEKHSEITRVLVRDAYMDAKKFNEDFEVKDPKNVEYADIKWENTIDRKTGTAKHPRQLERVPAGSAFNVELVYDLYDDVNEDYKDNNGKVETIGFTKLQKHLWALDTAMRLLQDDYIGGHGSRGYGRIEFTTVNVDQRNVGEDQYKSGESHDEVKAFKAKWQPQVAEA